MTTPLFAHIDEVSLASSVQYALGLHRPDKAADLITGQIITAYGADADMQVPQELVDYHAGQINARFAATLHEFQSRVLLGDRLAGFAGPVQS